MIVWDLFGGGLNSVYNALKDNPQYEVWTFDITTSTRDKHIVMDLTQDNIIEAMSKFPKPDIIVASPLCQSFSILLVTKDKGRLGWKPTPNGYVLRERERWLWKMFECIY